MQKKLLDSEKILQIVKKFTKKKKISFNENLIKNNILDSLTLAELIFDIEDQFKIKFSQKDLNIKYFKNINTIIKLVSKKK